jgi:hypothetical protein
MFIKRLLARIIFSIWRVIKYIIPSSIIRALARLLFSKSWERFETACKQPAKAQTDKLLEIVRRNQDTEYGKKYDFKNIKSVEDFQNKVPICSYEDIEPYINKMMDGEENVLVADHVPYFAVTSGTTGPAKYIPVTKAYQDECRTGRRVWFRQIAQVFPKLIRGTLLTVHSPETGGKTKGGIPFGSITMATGAVDTNTAEKLEALEPFQKIPMAIFHIKDLNVKYYLLLRMAIVNQVSLIAAINPSTIILICQKLTEFAPLLIEDCKKGSIRKDLDISAELRERLQRNLTPNKKVARRIKRSLEKHGRVCPPDVWPRLCGLMCWKGGSAPFYLKQFSDWFGKMKVMDYGFTATEGNFSVIMSEEGSKGVLTVTAHFMEFIHEEERPSESPKVYTADQLEVGKRYYILITGSHGLYRYDMNDVVEVVGYFQKTPEIVFCHKGSNMISYTGEKIAESHVVDAISNAQQSVGVKLNGFLVTVSLDSTHPRYVFAVEVQEEQADEQLKMLLHTCEENLQSANIEYKSKRESGRLGDPVLTLVENGAFERWREDKLKNGAFDSHVKIPHLSPDPEVLKRLRIEKTLEF